MKINCISCGHELDLSDSYEDYEGVVKCWVCAALLEIKSVGGQLKLVAFAERRSFAPAMGRPLESGI